jgi:hypothetical protein
MSWLTNVLPGGAMTIEQTAGLRLLATLCRELATLGLDVGMSDAKPALSVRLGRADPRLWVSVDLAGGCYVWQGAGRRRHPVTDPAGAAKLIAGDAPHRGGPAR